jgi:hypothetical protein
MKNKYNFAARAALLALALTTAFAFTTNGFAYSTAASAVPGAGSTVSSNGILPGSLWYNGDLNHVNGLANENSDSIGAGEYAHVFDDFNVPTGQTWTVTGVYSNDYNNYVASGGTTTAVEWSIRQGITNGNGGTLIASGANGPGGFQVLFHNAGDFGYTEFTFNATGLNVTLTSGTYFLNVTPIGNGFGRSFDSDTSGAGCVGTPCGNNGNSFFDSNFFGANYQGPGAVDFSMGVQGVIAPEPPPWAMMAMGAVVLIGVQQLRGRRKKAQTPPHSIRC